jgi:hypothetical protein
MTMSDSNALARLLAVEVLLAEPELLGNDALEADLYILRDKLREAARTAGTNPPLITGRHGSAGCASS